MQNAEKLGKHANETDYYSYANLCVMDEIPREGSTPSEAMKEPEIADRDALELVDTSVNKTVMKYK